jgi:hypothetical protein
MSCDFEAVGVGATGNPICAMGYTMHPHCTCKVEHMHCHVMHVSARSGHLVARSTLPFFFLESASVCGAGPVLLLLLL